VIVLRHVRPEVARPFKAPWTPVLPALGILLCGYLMKSLPFVTWMRFLVWLALGLVIYFAYGMRKSALARQPEK
jgi:APA family basic amino acid/polyamine antiporter